MWHPFLERELSLESSGLHQLIQLLVVMLVIVTVLAEIFMPQVMLAFVPGFVDDREKLDHLMRYLMTITDGLILVFVETKRNCDHVEDVLEHHRLDPAAC